MIKASGQLSGMTGHRGWRRESFSSAASCAAGPSPAPPSPPAPSRLIFGQDIGAHASIQTQRIRAEAGDKQKGDRNSVVPPPVSQDDVCATLIHIVSNQPVIGRIKTKLELVDLGFGAPSVD